MKRTGSCVTGSGSEILAPTSEYRNKTISVYAKYKLFLIKNMTLTGVFVPLKVVFITLLFKYIYIKAEHTFAGL